VGSASGRDPSLAEAPALPVRSAIARRLERAPGPVFVAVAIGAAFSAYFCMYAFRKPFAAATFAGEGFGGVALKTSFVISQIVGYALSKFVGIKVCSEVSRGRRAAYLVLFVLWAEAALVLFAVAPPALKVAAMFLNGLPLGMVWGLVVWYLEGRRTSEILLAGLSCSFILASGAVKDTGSLLMSSFGVSEWWMPAVTGFLFLPPYLLSVWILNQLPEPSPGDIAARVERETMNASQRLAFVKQFLPGLVLLLVVYFFLTAYRDFRDNYQRELFDALGYERAPAIFTRAELLVAFGVMGALAMLYFIKDNRRGLLGAYAIMVGGIVLLGGSTLLLDAGKISGFWWMALVGLGSYLTYVPYGSVLFDRLIASTRTVGTAVFAIYVADAIGYTGSVGVQLYKDLAQGEVTRLGFFRGFTYFLALLGAAFLLASAVYFQRKTKADAARQ
jgi:hypothetical protein